MDNRPQFEREVYERWLAAKSGNPDQLARYRSALAWYDDQATGDLFTPPQPEPTQQPSPAQQPDPYPDRVKVWSLVGFAAINNKLGGAWRLWMLARALDQSGSGVVAESDLRDYCKHLGVSERLQRYWLAAAIRSGILAERVYKRSGDRVFILASLGRGAAAIGAQYIGRPAEVSSRALVKSGWKRHLWAAYLATLNGRPVSQQKKFELTGIEPRVQRLWQRPDKRGDNLSYPVYRYSDSEIEPDPVKVEAMSELTGRHYLIADGETRQRLPDGRIVHPEASRSLLRGRSRKAQKLLNDLSSLLGRGAAEVVRLFAEAEQQHDRFEQVKRLLRRARSMDHDKRPDHVFVLSQRSGRLSNYHAATVIPLVTSAS